MALLLGAHLSVARGLAACARQAASIGATTFAYFTRNPRGGSARALDEADLEAMARVRAEAGIGTVVAHAPYTYNLCSAKEDVRAFARRSMREDLERLELVGDVVYNLHPGSHTGLGTERGVELVAEGIREACEPGQRTTVLLETMAGKGSEVGSTFEELARIVELVGDAAPVGVCLDTCHVSDAGYPVARSVEDVLDEFDRVVGLDLLRALHLNDSMNPPGSRRDRHERIGAGELGLNCFVAVVTNPRLAGLPMVLETPNEPEGWAREIALLRRLAGEG